MTGQPHPNDARTLGLCRFVVRGSGDHYAVISREGRQAIGTSEAGVEAIRLLSDGCTVEHTQRILGERFGRPAEEIDLTPVLEALFASGFVRTVDGRPLATRGEETGPGVLRLWSTLLVWAPLLQLTLKYLPPRLALSIAYECFARAPGAELERRIAANLRRAPGLGATDGDIARIATANHRALSRQFCDRLLLGSSSSRRLRHWLGRSIRVSGLGHLARSVARGGGTILCSFHFGSYGLIPFVLGARGVAVTMYAGFGEDARADVAAWLAERARRGDAYPVRITGGAMGLRALVHCLERGETVLLYCDRLPADASRVLADTRGRITVPFLGTRIWSAQGLGWLHSRTGATVLPAVLLWEGNGRHHLHIDAAIAGERSESTNASAVMVAAYGALERYVRRIPWQWLKWEDFGGMISA